jgi:cytochrome c peroxidase
MALLTLAAFFAVTVTVPLGLDLYMPVPEDNPVTTEKLELGRRLFHDRRLSRDRSISCASCHDPNRAFSDGRTVAVGVFGRKSRRNVPAIINRGYGRAFFWDGHVDSLEEQVVQPILNPREMDLTLEEASERVGLTPKEIAGALATYVRSILSGNSRYDRFIYGDRDALSEDEQLGLKVFRGKGNCILCHVGPNLSDEKLHNTGVAWQNGRLLDPGAGHGEFKTPTLREVPRTDPYMHDGSLKSLEEVVEFYDRGGNQNPHLDPELRPLKLTAEEKKALVAFLHSLTGEIVEGVLVQESVRNGSH